MATALNATSAPSKVFRKPIFLILQKTPARHEKNHTSKVNRPLAQAPFHRFNNIPDRLCNSSKVGKINRIRGHGGPAASFAGGAGRFFRLGDCIFERRGKWGGKEGATPFGLWAAR